MSQKSEKKKRLICGNYDCICLLLIRFAFQGLPCHLYFDLEFSTKENADRDGDEMVDLLISAIFQALLDKYTIQGHHEWILELDSSTDGIIPNHLSFYIEEIPSLY